MFSLLAPQATNKRIPDIAAAPAPIHTIFMSSICLPTSSSEFNKPAAVTIAVPCWSSWNTGILHCSISDLSISKHSGALISSKFIPPKVSAIRATVSIKACGLSALTSISIELIPAKCLNNKLLPSKTGLEANAPKLPKLKIALPSEITATRLPLLVYL